MTKGQDKSKKGRLDELYTIYTSPVFLVALIYVSIVNFFLLKTTPELILLQFAVLVLIFRKLRIKEFSKAWIPFILLFVLYEILRGIADDFSPFFDETILLIYNIETRLFGEIPTLYLQKYFSNSHLLTQISAFFYSLFFYYSFLVAFVIWLKKPDLFRTYVKRFLIMSYIGLLFFFLIPTAPPWLMHEIKGIGVERYLYGETVINNFVFLNFYNYFVYGNAVAALPSLHTAWPAFTTLFILKVFKRWYGHLLLIIPLMISFGVILTGEHYFIDVVFGWLFAAIAVLWPSKDENNKTLKT